jgi:hypothetical protein
VLRIRITERPETGDFEIRAFKQTPDGGRQYCAHSGSDFVFLPREECKATPPLAIIASEYIRDVFEALRDACDKFGVVTNADAVRDGIAKAQYDEILFLRAQVAKMIGKPEEVRP